MIRICLTLFLLTLSAASFSQATSPLVYTGGNGKLEYALYANKGQIEQVNKLPDFSWAGYKKGGVSLPVVPVVLTLEPIAGDNWAHIQMAIDQVSAMTPDQDGIRGAILLKAGKYDCSGPLTIKASGVIIRGEGQKPSGIGGTQLHATATTQHTLITFSGIQPSAASSVFVLDTIVVPQRKTGDFNGDGIQETIDGKIWLSASVTEAAAFESEGDQILSLRLAANNGEYVAYDSKENNNKPYLRLKYRMTATGRDSLISISPTDDVYVRGGEYATLNYGTDNSLVIKNEGAGSSVTREFYLKFTLPSIDADLTEASLFLYCNNAGDNGDQLNFVSAIPNDQWTEMTVNYQNQPFSPSQNTRITSPYLATGSNSFTVEKADGYKAGELIAVLRTPNQVWIDDLQMAQYGWTASAYKVAYERRITAVKGDTITVDIPMVQAIEQKYGGGEIYKLDNSGRTRNCGIEDLFITSHYAFDEDENHGWTAVSFSHTEDCWARNVTAQYFGYGCIGLRGAMNTTVQDCAMLDPKSITTGSRKYSFYIDKGSFNLFQRCYTRGGRHDYVTGSQVAGPNVFLDCLAEQTHADIGPHHRYATGLLFDNIKGGQTRVQNRKDSGTGHGWAGAQTMFWNLEVTGSDIKVESPIGAMNWGIGCMAPTKYGDGYWDNWGTHVVPRSLYIKQLEDRLGPQAVENITIRQQREKPIWDLQAAWKGIGQLTTNALTEVSSDPDFKLYPNPTSGTITVETSPNNNGKIWFIYSADGRLEKSGVLDAHPCKVNLTGLPSGLYFFKVENEARGIRFIRK